MEMECPRLTVNREDPMKGLIGPGNSGFSGGIDGLWALVTDASLVLLILRVCQWILRTVPVVLKRLTYLKIRMHQDRSQDSTIYTRAVESTSTICSHIKIPTSSYGEKTIGACELNSCQSKSTNVGKEPPKIQLFMPIVMAMTPD